MDTDRELTREEIDWLYGVFDANDANLEARYQIALKLVEMASTEAAKLQDGVLDAINAASGTPWKFNDRYVLAVALMISLVRDAKSFGLFNDANPVGDKRDILSSIIVVGVEEVGDVMTIAYDRVVEGVMAEGGLHS